MPYAALFSTSLLRPNDAPSSAIRDMKRYLYRSTGDPAYVEHAWNLLVEGTIDARTFLTQFMAPGQVPRDVVVADLEAELTHLRTLYNPTPPPPYREHDLQPGPQELLLCRVDLVNGQRLATHLYSPN